MRKRVIPDLHQGDAPGAGDWLRLEDLAEVEISSEDASHPIESALMANNGIGWRAAAPGKQTIRLIFSPAQTLHRIYLSFVESATQRTQEYVLRWSTDGGRSFRDIVRQQWNFSPDGSTSQNEEHRVELGGVNVLELTITPDIGNPTAFASLAALRVA